MKGKDPRDAHFITSRICGICGDNHATCSCYAQNMAYGVKPPNLAESDRQPRRGLRGVHVRPQQNIYPGESGRASDYCEKMVSVTNPSVLAKAETSLTRRMRLSTATRPSAT